MTSRWDSASRLTARLYGVRTSHARLALTALAVFVVLYTANLAEACPFCAAVSPSMSDRLKVARFAVVARIVGDRQPEDRYVREIPFAPVRFLKGDIAEFGTQQIMAPIPQDPFAGDHFFTMGAPEADIAGGDRLVWSLPLPVSDEAADYIANLNAAPASGGDRVTFFIPFLNHPDPLIARDAYDEFGAAPYEDVKAAAAHLPCEELKQWIADESIPANDRRLYLTLLGVCGEADDAPELLSMIERSVATPGSDSALDAMIACYLTLSGEAGLAPINQLILQNPDSSLGDLQSAILALRFHGEEETLLERQALLKSMRLLLDRPAAADLVIRDLARWEDWTVLDQLVALFRDTSAENAFLRVPIVKYLQACPLPEAATALTAIEADFPDVVARANVLPFELGQRRNPEDARRTPAIPSAQDSPEQTEVSESGSANPQNETAGTSAADSTDAEADDDLADGDVADDDAADDDAALSETTDEASQGWLTNLNVGFIFVGIGLLAIFVILLILR